MQWEAADHSDVGESSLFCGGYPDGHFTCEVSKTGRRLPQVFLAARGFDGEGCGALSFAQILCGGRLQTPITLRDCTEVVMQSEIGVGDASHKCFLGRAGH